MYEKYLTKCSCSVKDSRRTRYGLAEDSHQLWRTRVEQTRFGCGFWKDWSETTIPLYNIKRGKELHERCSFAGGRYSFAGGVGLLLEL